MVARSIIKEILGNVESPHVLDYLFDCFSVRWSCRTVDGVIKSVKRTRYRRSDVEVIIGAKIARAFKHIAMQTYERRPIISGMMVVEKWVLVEQGSYLPFLILRFENPLSLPVDSLVEMEGFAQLADGKHSLLLADTFGKLYGVLGIEVDEPEGISIGYPGYLIITNHNREVLLYSASAPVCHYNGFEWRSGIPTDKVWNIAYWTWGDDIHKDGLENKVWERSKAFVDIIEQLSNLRFSSIIAVCDRSELNKIRDKGLIRPLRAELNNVEWPELETPPRSYLNIFRLDGAHFVSKEFRLMSACQQVIIERPEVTSDSGTGKGAARQLSKMLGESAFVIKISTDGPISVFRNGSII